MKPTEYPKSFLNSKLTGDYYDWVISSIEESNYDVSEILGNKKTTTILQVYEASKKLSRKRKNKTEAKKLGDELSTIVKECHNEFVSGSNVGKVDNKKVKKSLGRVKGNLNMVDEQIIKKEKKIEFANAIIDGDLEKLKKLVYECDVNEKLDNHLGSPLFLALDSGKYDVASFLIQKGADINEEIGYGNILMKFVRDNDYESVKLLVDMGANLSVKDSDKDNVFSIAVRENNPQIFKKLMEGFKKRYHDGNFNIMTYGDIIEGEMDGTEKGNLLSLAVNEISIEKFIDYLVKVNLGKKEELLKEYEKDGEVWLLEKSQEFIPKKEIISIILENYSKSDINDGDKGHNALYFAIVSGNVEGAKMLIDAGADAKIKVEHKDNLYKLAKFYGNKEMIEVVGKNLSFIDKILSF
jgi:ankyrin repeat protein